MTYCEVETKPNLSFKLLFSHKKALEIFLNEIIAFDKIFNLDRYETNLIESRILHPLKKRRNKKFSHQEASFTALLIESTVYSNSRKGEVILDYFHYSDVIWRDFSRNEVFIFDDATMK